MSRKSFWIAVGAVAGIAAVFLLPPAWLAPIAETAAICAAVLAVIVRLGAVSEASGEGSILLSLLNLPEQPLAKVREGWTLISLLALAAFLVSLGLSVMVRANA